MTMITKKSIRDSFRSTKQAKLAEIAALQEQIAAARAELNAIRAEEKAQLATVPSKAKAKSEPKSAPAKQHPFADLLVIPAIGTHMAAASFPVVLEMEEPDYVTDNRELNALLYLYQMANSGCTAKMEWAYQNADSVDATPALLEEMRTVAEKVSGRDFMPSINGVSFFGPLVSVKDKVESMRESAKQESIALSRFGTVDAAFDTPAERVIAVDTPLASADHMLQELKFWSDLSEARRALGEGSEHEREDQLHKWIHERKLTKKQAAEYLAFCKTQSQYDPKDSFGAERFVEVQDVVIRNLLSPKKGTSNSVEKVDTTKLEAEAKYQADVAALALD